MALTVFTCKSCSRITINSNTSVAGLKCLTYVYLHLFAYPTIHHMSQSIYVHIYLIIVITDLYIICLE